MGPPADKPQVPKVPGLRVETELWESGHPVVAGVDEVGRGSLAGPMTVGAFVLPRGRRFKNVRDSKMLTPSRREVLAAKLKVDGVAWAVGHASPAEIDEAGLSGALALAGRRAIAALGIEVDAVIVDGSFDFLRDPRSRTVVKGDRVSLTVACASVIAKVERDAIMTEYEAEFPGYGFAGHKGYSSEEHRAALRRLGPSPIHRRSFSPVAELLGEAVPARPGRRAPEPAAGETDQLTLLLG